MKETNSDRKNKNTIIDKQIENMKPINSRLDATVMVMAAMT